MRAKKIFFKTEITEKTGIAEVKMSKLDKVVIIAGKNGSGKSRLLTLIKSEFNNYPNQNGFDTYYNAINRDEEEIERLDKINKQRRLNKIQSLNISFVALKNIEEEIRKNDERIENLKNRIKEIKNKITSLRNKIEFDEHKIDNSIIEFVPNNLKLQDSYTITPNELDRYAQNIYTIGTAQIHQGTIPAIEKIQKSWINANTTTIDDLNLSQEEIKKINEAYDKLKNYIKIFLNTDLKRTSQGYPELFGKRIGECNLSNGQKILLQFCMALYAQETKLENLIILMDEPENHLHPAALIEVLEKITAHVTNGQIFIATHSINVLAHFDPSNIWYIENGFISYAGNIPRTVLEGLLGKEEEIEKLSNFLSLPTIMASNRFSFESLFFPEVKITGPDDPQVNQIHEIIKKRSEDGSKLKVLDFGVGKCRLLSTIYENERMINSDLNKWLDFYGYDKYDTYKDLSSKVFTDIYGSSEDRYFNVCKDILSRHDENTFDYIIMSNVFHEIDPKEWINLFTSATSPFKLLKDNGYLLIIEDQFLAMGEKAHSKGFLVYDELEFKKLFKITTEDKYFSTDYRNDGRLKSHHIPKECVFRIDADSKKLSLQTLWQNAKDEIKKLREEKSPNYKTGKLHGFWTQQLANASLALEEL